MSFLLEILSFLCELDIDGWRVDGILVSTPKIILIGKILLPNLVISIPQDSLKTTGVCILNNARLGVWVIGTYLHLFGYFGEKRFSLLLVCTVRTRENKLDPYVSINPCKCNHFKLDLRVK